MEIKKLQCFQWNILFVCGCIERDLSSAFVRQSNGTGNTWTVHVVLELVSGFFVRSHFNTMLKEFFESRGWCEAGAHFVL